MLTAREALAGITTGAAALTAGGGTVSAVTEVALIADFTSVDGVDDKTMVAICVCSAATGLDTESFVIFSSCPADPVRFCPTGEVNTTAP